MHPYCGMAPHPFLFHCTRLEEELRRQEEAERLQWMRETEERRRLVQQHMANLKRQRALEAERSRMAKEEALAWALVREEERCGGRGRQP